jgi:hypothetical protein
MLLSVRLVRVSRKRLLVIVTHGDQQIVIEVPI